MRKRGYYVNNTLLRASGQVNSKERQSNKGTSGQVNKLIVKKDKVTGEQVDKLDELTSKQVNSKGRQSNRGTGVSTYNIWGEKGLKKARD